ADEGTDTVRTALAAYTIAGNLENLTYTGAAAFAGIGNSLANTIRGAVGADTLDGKAGADILIGGAGNDTYIVDDAADVVTEVINEGTDLVKTALSAYALTNVANVENLTFTGTGDFSGTGNSLANVITGGTGNDTLDGGAGADTLVGGLGNDIYIVDMATDVVTEAAGAGTDEIRASLAAYSIAALANIENLTYTGSENFTGTGNVAANTITGGAGNDTLNGGAGADTLVGASGNDTYVVDNVGDVVIENANEGTDTIKTALASYSLAAVAGVENLTYTGTAAFMGAGNDLNNILTGGAAADNLSGGAGADTLIGGAGSDRMSGGVGDDTYVVDVATDIVVENPNEGTDTVQTTLASYIVGTNVENLTYTGTAAFTGTGNGAVNVMTGGAGADTLDGKAGADTLIGGGGNDTYIVETLGDVVVEASGGGTDVIKTDLASYSLAAIANVENLTFTGSGGFTGTGNTLDNVITGGAGDDTLSGDAGNDTLNGGAGADALSGGTGNDIYVVDNAGDTVTENADEGTDTVQTNLASYTLGTDVENLTNTGTATFAGNGNALNNVMTGGTSVDTLKGGAGDDTYVISTGDIVVENANEGIDTVQTNLASYTLGANLENLISTRTTGFFGTGNTLDNIIKGGAAADRLTGAAGNDTLDGG
ncbi:beta strand repeat-containing protein, partial [Neorhizobium vignae]|uniref:beta strand repeat-containing protein n=1 Tax=Neorhizobium vignae TaxID=690585 RepID=UPI00138E1680